jgi:hypothetical protein
MPPEICPQGFLDFLLPLHRVFTPRQQVVTAKRGETLAAAQVSKLKRNYGE